jgi:hypothetical protein
MLLWHGPHNSHQRDPRALISIWTPVDGLSLAFKKISKDGSCVGRVLLKESRGRVMLHDSFPNNDHRNF